MFCVVIHCHLPAFFILRFDVFLWHAVTTGVTRSLSQRVANAAEGDPLPPFGLVPKRPYTAFHKNRPYLSVDGMSFNWVNDFKVEFHVFM